MRSRERGVAIVLAMGVLALAATAAVAIVVSHTAWSRERQQGADGIQAHVLVRAGMDWARAVLSDDRRTSSADHFGEPWALRLPPIRIENAELSGQLDDQQGAFNLNNLAAAGSIDPAQMACFRRLLSVLGLPGHLADALADWIDADAELRLPGGAEDGYYAALPAPHLAANRPLTDVVELAVVRGFEAEVMARLRPFVTALPRFTAVNVNTATPEVLAAVVPGLSLDAARELVAQRERVFFRDRNDFLRRLPATARPAGRDIAASSDFFTATLIVRVGEAEARGVVLLLREGMGWPAVVWRKQS
jgi:general secretion pathway protein K